MKVKVNPGETVLHDHETHTAGESFECKDKVGAQLVRLGVVTDLTPAKPGDKQTGNPAPK